MFLTRDCEMGIRGVLHLAVHGGQGGMTADDVAKGQHLSPSYLSRVFYRMVDAGILVEPESGRFQLARAPEQITVRAIVESFSVPLQLTRCLVHHGKIHPCNEQGGCELFAMWRDLSGAVLKALETRTLADMIRVAPQAPVDCDERNPVPH